MSARSDANPVASLPIQPVVTRLVCGGAGVVGDFIGGQTMGLTNLMRELIEIGGQLLGAVELLAARRAAAKGGPGLNRQLIGRYMASAKGQDFADWPARA